MEPKAALQRAAEELARQRAEIAALRAGTNEPIAIVGMACRLPGAETPGRFWELLDRGGDAVTEVPRERWDAGAFYDADPAAPGKMSTRQGAFIRDVDRFDAAFFGIAPREAQSLDPQQRLLLEVAWEALEHANIAPSSLYGTATGVFVGITCFDHAIRMSQADGGFNSYTGTGSALNMAAGRVSYVLGLTGPSMAVDTACSSSLVCLHLACLSLRQRESNAALVGGVHLILSPEVMVSFSQARMLAADGRSKTFDASADGYSRGEGCGVVVLKRLSDAIADRDTILGLVRGSAVNQDGPSGGLTVPNGASQQQVIARALSAAGVPPAAVAYVECHGTGTALGDPIEVEALARVYGKDRAAGDPLLIGSAKTNIGHLEPAAGMAGLIKILLAFEHGRIPRHLHFKTPNPHIPWADVPIAVTKEQVDWPRRDHARLAGLSAFGFSGTNVHVILEEAPASRQTARPVLSEQPAYMLPLSAKSDAALVDLAARYVDTLKDAGDLASICYAAGAGRSHFPHRLAVVASSMDEARLALEAFVNNTPSPAWRGGKAANEAYRRDARDVKARLARAYEQRALDEIAALYLEGVAIDWRRLHADEVSRHAALPTYPFQRERFWIDTPGQKAAASADLTSCLYQTTWTTSAPTTGVSSAGERRWSIVLGDQALAQAVRDQLTRRGAPATLLLRGDAAADGTTDIIYTTAARDPLASSDACAGLLALAQSLLAARSKTPRLWIVTRGATAARNAMDAAGAAQAPLAAFARVLALEHPELVGRLIDLDPAAAGGTDEADTLLTEILTEDAEDQIAIRGGARLAPRVETAAGARVTETPVRADASYLITGGLGRLGLHTAQWLSQRGARHFVLLGRSGVSTPEQRAQIAALEARGTRVRVAIGDVADRGTVTTLIRDLEAPLGGVVHAAGVPGWIDLTDLTRDALTAVLRPKIDGAWVLHEATRGVPLDFFVCFSSIASAWGSRGQAHYAAANAFLDALAYLRRGEGLPAVTINWGPWADGGMTTSEAETLLRRVGVRPLPTGTAIAALDAFAAGDRAQIVVADIDWSLFRGSYEARGHRRLLERLTPAADTPAGGGDRDLVRRIHAASPPERERLVSAVVATEVAEVLALPAGASPDLDQGLFEMGMDSLMALELRTRLQTLIGRALPATLVFDCPTIAAVARFLIAELTTSAAPAIAAPARPATPARAPATDLDTLSEADAETLLLKTLESIP